MRTTLDIDDDVLNAARALADARKTSVGKAVSDLARRGAAARLGHTMVNGFPVFNTPAGAPSFGPEDVEAALEADDLEYARYFLKPERP
jgi:hypothetical protein